MTKQKHGLWVFLFSLIPGAGEMYMGFRKQGLSIMLVFWGTIALASVVNFGWLIMFLPILWFYSFFNVHNLKSLSEEDFYSVEDTYILHLDQFIGSTDSAIKKHRTVVAIILIIFGVSILWNNFTDLLFFILPEPINSFLSTLFYQLPGSVIAVAIIAAGIYLLRNKKQQLDQEEKAAAGEEHYWEPYRPYQQSTDPESEICTPPTGSAENRTVQEAKTAATPAPETPAEFPAETESSSAASQASEPSEDVPASH